LTVITANRGMSSVVDKVTIPVSAPVNPVNNGGSAK
jgi:hypothetical protein